MDIENLPNICFVVNIVQKLQQRIIQDICTRARELPMDDNSIKDFIRNISSSGMSLSYLDGIFVAEYIYNSICVHDDKKVVEEPYLLLDHFKGTFKVSSTSTWSTARGMMGFMWSASRNTELFTDTLLDFPILDLQFLYGCYQEHGFHKTLKIIKEAYATRQRNVFFKYYSGATTRQNLYTYQIAPEITQHYVTGCCASAGDPSDSAFYRRIIESSE